MQAFAGVQEYDELLMPVADHVSPDHRAIENVERDEQRRGVAIMGHRAKPPFLERQTRLGPVKRLDLALSVEGRDDGMGGRIDIESDRVMEFIREAGIVGDILQLLDAPGECDLPRFAKGGALGMTAEQVGALGGHVDAVRALRQAQGERTNSNLRSS